MSAITIAERLIATDPARINYEISEFHQIYQMAEVGQVCQKMSEQVQYYPSN
jgi:hypothetical protein